MPPFTNDPSIPASSGEPSLLNTSQKRNGFGYAAEVDPMSSTAHQRNQYAHRRNGSSLKNVVRKMFSRKGRDYDDSIGSGTRRSSLARNFSTPPPQSTTADERVPMTPVNDGTEDSIQATPLMETDGNRTRLPEEEPISRPKSSANSEPATPRTRRATVPSLVMLDNDSRVSLGKSRAEDNHKSEPHRQKVLESRRRSRSATTLRGTAYRQRVLAEQQQNRHRGSLERDRRGARPPAPVFDLTSTLPTNNTSNTTSNKPIGVIAGGNKQSRHAPRSVSSPAPESDIFNAGELISALQGDDVSLEQRLTTLEVKLIDLELAIARMQGPGGKTMSASIPRHRPSASQNNLVREEAGSLSSGETLTRDNSSNNVNGSRSFSGSTVHHDQQEPLPELSGSISKGTSPVSIEQYTALVMLLREERSSRRNLEEQIASLQENVRQLQGGAGLFMNIGTRYPIQSMNLEGYDRYNQTIESSPTGSPASTEEERFGPGPAYVIS